MSAARKANLVAGFLQLFAVAWWSQADRTAATARKRGMLNKIPDSSESRYRGERRAQWNLVARGDRPLSALQEFYHQQMTRIYRALVAPGLRVLEVGCGRGDLLAAVEPSFGVGVDVSETALREARRRHPRLHFVQGDAGHLPISATFDILILADVVNDLWDVEAVFKGLRSLMAPSSRVILNAYSRVWELPRGLAQRLGLATPLLVQNWLTPGDLRNLLRLAGLESIKEFREVLLPAPIPLFSALANRYLARLTPFDRLDLTNVLVARPGAPTQAEDRGETVSVIIPARNEAENIEGIFRRTPELGAATELIFVEGHSRDGTYESIERAIADHPERRAKLFRQTGTGKGDAVRLGFDRAEGDVLMILDADLTVQPEDLSRFYQALVTGQGDFINGVRLTYPMDREAMRFLNLVGNRLFSIAFSWLLGQPVKDTLCGTKVLWKKDYERLKRNRPYFGDFDPFGDFDLLFGAAKLNLRIVDVPIRYHERTYGRTNIDRWRHGLLLARMVLFAARRIKFT